MPAITFRFGDATNRKLKSEIILNRERGIAEKQGKTIDVISKRTGKVLRRKKDLSDEKKKIQDNLNKRRIMNMSRDSLITRIQKMEYENIPVVVDGQEGIQMVVDGFHVIVVNDGEKMYWADNLRQLTEGERESIDNDERWKLEGEHFEAFSKVVDLQQKKKGSEEPNMADEYEKRMKENSKRATDIWWEKEQIVRQAANEADLLERARGSIIEKKRQSDELALFESLKSSNSIVSRSITRNKNISGRRLRTKKQGGTSDEYHAATLIQRARRSILDRRDGFSSDEYEESRPEERDRLSRYD
tara:strand:+ start:2169 stop:3074 length:906 start_codon:yes stop_codon:yes gene_type:complete